MTDNVLAALQSLHVSDLDHDGWITVGMALKYEGYSCGVWDDWSRNDERYHAGECERKWDGFHGSDKPVTGATIVQMAKDKGWRPDKTSKALAWDDFIEDDGDEPVRDKWESTADLIRYLEVIFDPEDKVGYVTNDAYPNKDGKWVPNKGNYDRTAGDLITALKARPNDLGYAMGDYHTEAGAWIRFNPLDGEGVTNANVVKFKYALVESDSVPIAEQDALYRKLQLPIAALVNSGGKSIHAIVHVDAKDKNEYRDRVEFLYSFLEENGLKVDRQNSNPSRLSRMPGVSRNNRRQYLMATNIGKKSWSEWKDFADGYDDNLPPIIPLKYFFEHPPVMPPELIEGILRCQHKMIIAGASKAGKSFLAMELCLAIASGGKWLDTFQCMKGKVLYINLEIDENVAGDRFLKICQAFGLDKNKVDGLDLWNLRGHSQPLDKLAPQIINQVKDCGYDAIVLDPIYKIITGDENSATDMSVLCNAFDKIIAETNAALIYVHHHAKGAAGTKKAQDRASGSGVFARDPDAQLDVTELVLTDDIKNNVSENGATGWRMESSLREFKNIEPLNMWFEFPVHRLDTTGELAKCFIEGTGHDNLYKTSKQSTPDDRRQRFINAFDLLDLDGTDVVTVEDMAKFLQCSEQTVRNYLKKDVADLFDTHYGKILRIQ